jgi:ABC-type uncharacterized transport system substrate-binding protein
MRWGCYERVAFMKPARVLALLFLLVFAALVAWHNNHRPRVLVLHSYATDYSWTRDIDIGLARVFEKHGDWAVRSHYMDLKRHPWPAFREAAGQRARRAIDTWQPDIVIAIDDDAQRYAARHYVDHPRIQIVFAGINGDVTPYGYEGAGNVIGILERKPLAAIRDALRQSSIGGKALRLRHLGDASRSVAEDDKLLRAFSWSPYRLLDSQLAKTYPAWQAAVESAANDSDVLLISNYRQLQRSDTDNTLVPPDEVVSWTEAHTTLPVIGMNGFYADDGGMLAIGTSGYEQGETAARYAERLLAGDAPASLPLDQSRQYLIYMHKGAMARHGLDLPNVYEAFARGLNHYAD